MELIPIIKLSLIVFTLVSGFVIAISYMMYKLRKGEKKPWLRKTLQSITKVREVSSGIAEYHPAPAFAMPQSYSEQISQASFRRAKPAPVRVQRAEKPRERFQIVNNQQVELRKVNYYSSQVREFQPQNEQKAFHKSFNRNNVLSNYSSGTDGLQKMKLS